jgi:hypothetical protein
VTLPHAIERNVIRLGAVAIALACWGCSPQPDPATLYIPDTAGLVRRSEVVGQDYRLTLDDGRTLTYPVNGNFIQGKQPRGDTAVVAGTQPVPWVYSADLRPANANVPPGCYVVLGRARMNETHVFQRVTDVRGEVVMAFPKTGDWTVVGVLTDGSGDLAGVGTCINPQGQAFRRVY